MKLAPARRSPPHHRHDGTSPLPLGMDASPPPRAWDGANTVWPHDPRTGWSYCVTIPSWVIVPEGKAADGTFINPAVFYRVQVGVQSPQGVSALRGVLRRFSDFLKLYAALKPLFKKRVPPPPPKNSLLRTNTSHSLLQERRHALADWVARLLEDIEISRSAPIAAFFELEAAARLGVNAVPNAGGVATQSSRSMDESQLPGVSWNDGPSVASVSSLPSMLDIASDAGCSTSGLRTPTSEIDIEMEALPDGIVEDRTVGTGTAKDKDKDEINSTFSEISRTPSDAHRRKLSADSASSSKESTAADSTSVLVAGVEQRMASLPNYEAEFLRNASVVLPTDQRGSVKRAITALQRRYEIVKADMEDLITRLQQEAAVKEFLTSKVRDLEGELDNTRRKSQETLRQAISLERERVTELQWELEECRAALMNAEEGPDPETSTAGTSNGDSQAFEEVTSLRLQITSLEEKLEAMQKERDTIEARARADKRVLAKEVMALRKQQQPEMKQELEMALQSKLELERMLQGESEKQESVRASNSSFVHEVSALRQRLQECSVDFLAKEDGKSGSKTSDAMELLTTSDDRIGALLAEAQLMAQEGNESSEEPSFAGMRKMLVDILIDNAQLRKTMNSLTRSAIVTVQKRDKEAMEEPIVRRGSILDRFL